MNFRKLLAVLSIAVLFSSYSFSQNQDIMNVEPLVFESDTVSQDGTKKHYFVAAGGVLLVNGIIGSWNRFVSRAPWAQVTWDEVKHPWERELVYDRDWYWTNFVLHPYQGGLYYLAARNSNLNLFESFLYTAAGSATWEYFFELNAPSINDLCYTSIGGMITGEMLYRLGLEAQGKNKTVLSFIANPLRLYTDPVLRQKPQGSSGMLEDCSLKFGFGMAVARSDAHVPYSDINEVFPCFGNVELRTLYADPYGHDSNIPYSQFYFEFGGAGGKGSGEGVDDTEKKLMYDVHIFSDGMILSRAPDMGGGKDTTVGICMEYDFVWNSFMEFSSIAPGFAFKQRINGDGAALSYQLRTSWVIMGTSDFFYLHRNVYEKPDFTYRDYGYSTGAELVGKIAYAKKNGIVFDWTLHGYAFWKYPYQTQKIDDSGWEFIAFSDVSLEMPVSEKINIGISDELYLKTTAFDNEKNITQIHNSVNVYARFKFL